MNHRSNLLALLLVLPTPTVAMEKDTKDKLIIFSVACVGAFCGNLLGNILYPSRSKLSEDAMNLVYKINPSVIHLEEQIKLTHKKIADVYIDQKKINKALSNLKETDDWNLNEFVRFDNQFLNLKNYIDKVQELNDSRHKELMILKENNSVVSDWCITLEKKIDADLQKCQQLCFHLSEHDTRFVSIENKQGVILQQQEEMKVKVTKIAEEQVRNTKVIAELQKHFLQLTQNSSSSNDAESKDGE